ncbi:syncollin-like [Polypterus senegalus]
MKALVLTIALLVTLAGVWAQCPSPSDLKTENGTKICARMYENDHYYYDQCCGGNYLDTFSGDDMPLIPKGWNDRISSLVVGSRCDLTVWSRSKKEGTKRKFSSGIQYRLKDVAKGLFGNWDNSISSYYCKCA